MRPLIKLSNITKKYNTGGQDIFALDDVELVIKNNEYIAIVGSSGSGKSTLMNILGCLDQPTEGQYLLEGNDVSDMSDNALSKIRNEKIGFVFQNFNLLPKSSALKNVIRPMAYKRMSNREKVERAKAELERVGLADRVSHLPNELSGGQKQRVSIARALIMKPSLLLADEPTGNLDTKTTGNILHLFDQLHDEGQTVVLVTHDEGVAKRCHRRITLVDGKIAEDRVH